MIHDLEDETDIASNLLETLFGREELDSFFFSC